MTSTDTATAATFQRQRSRWLWWAVLAALVALVAAFLLGTRVKSPWEDAQHNATLSPLITASVSELTPTVPNTVFNGALSLGASNPTVVKVAGVELSVVTSIRVQAGDQVVPGTILGVVSGTAVAVLQLPFPLYRDLKPGDTGPDVSALQQALRDLGLYQAGVDGEYGLATAAAVTKLFGNAGGPAVAIELQEGVRTAQTALQQAAAQLEQAKQSPAPAPAEIAAAQAAVQAATLALDKARLQAATPLPAAAIVRIDGPSASVVSIAAVGSTVSGEAPFVVLRQGVPGVHLRIPVNQHASVTVGMEATVSSTANPALTYPATVTSISDFRTADATNTIPGYDLRLDLGATPDLTDGAEVVVRLATTTQPVAAMAVPLASVRQEGGQSYVERVDASGERVRVTVQVTGTQDGFAFIQSPDIKVGDTVVVPTS